MKKILIAVFGFLLGLLIGFAITSYTSLFADKKNVLGENTAIPRKQVIGFLPYWLLDKASADYSKYVTTLAYFGLRVDGRGHIEKFTSPTQSEPGYYALRSGKFDTFLKNAKDRGISLSLVIDSGNPSSIESLISDPIKHADTLASEVALILEQYGFSDVNLDIEYVNRATGEQRLNFTKFVSEFKKQVPKKTLTVEISNGDSIKPSLIDVSEIGKIADNIVLMAYDFHFTGSFVTGPVAPLSGAGTESEYDVSSALNNSLDLVPSEKLILGIPLYGYEWESLGSVPRLSAVPNSGLIASSARAQTILSDCNNCILKTDTSADEKYLVFFDRKSSTNHIIFFPDENSTSAKIKLANDKKLGGIALWALGYEGGTILEPLKTYK